MAVMDIDIFRMVFTDLSLYILVTFYYAIYLHFTTFITVADLEECLKLRPEAICGMLFGYSFNLFGCHFNSSQLGNGLHNPTSAMISWISDSLLCRIF
jgi:hypothetical protein